MTQAVRKPRKVWFDKGDDVPNSNLPVLIFRSVLAPGARDKANVFRERFRRSQWSGLWTDPIFDYTHFHSNAHEVLGIAEGKVTVPTGCGAFPRQYDRRGVPVNTNTAAARAGAETRFNGVHFTTMPRGGHFPAYEQPQLWLDDIRAFFRAQS